MMQKYCCDGFTEEYHESLPATPFPPEIVVDLKEYIQARPINTLQDAIDALDESVLIMFEGLRDRGLNDASDVLYGHIETNITQMIKPHGSDLSDWACPNDECECEKRAQQMKNDQPECQAFSAGLCATKCEDCQ